MWDLLAPSLYTTPTPNLLLSLFLSFSLSLSLSLSHTHTHTQAGIWHMHQKIGTYPLLHEPLNWSLFYCNILCNFTPFPSLSTFPVSSSYQRNSVQFSSVSQLCPTFCDPMNCSMLGLPVHHQLPEFNKIHVHCVSEAIQPSHPLLSPSPSALNLSQHQGLFKRVSSPHQVVKVLEFQLQHQSLQ